MRLSPTKQKGFNKKLYGYDVETYGNENVFYCSSLYSENFKKTFFSRDEAISFFKTKRFKDSYVVCSNLQFDFNATFYGKEDLNFMPLFRGSELLFQKTHIYDKRFNRKSNRYSRADSLSFIDTYNYVKMSVEQYGKILKIPKLKKPEFLGSIPKTEKQREELVSYNIRDAEISYRFIRLLFDNFIKLGATPKITIASTAMSLFKNKYLKDTYFTNDELSLRNIFKSYYGGRTEAFLRGYFENYYYYDVNSLYPYVMMNNSYPDPNTKRFNRINDPYYIENYEGVSSVDIFCPYMEYPLLPFRYEDKVIFPVGSFSGVYTNVELRKAMTLGYVIKKIHWNIYFNDNCNPFRDYVKDLYDKRMEYKKNDSNLQLVVKLLMNSLYGKFGEKFEDKDLFIPMPETAEELNKYDDFEIIQEYVRIKQKSTMPKPHCIPIWASYVTAYGRVLMYDLMLKYQPLYMDTDSLITRKKIKESTELGGLKLEHFVKKGVIVKPKFYAIKDKDWKIKIKGIGRGLNYNLFSAILNGDPIKYSKFTKFREALRRKLKPNEIIEVEKNLDLEDNKREWEKPFNQYELQISKPIKLINGKKEVYNQEYKCLNKIRC